MMSTNRYTPFSNRNKLDISIPIIELVPSSYVMKEYVINQQYGSAFDKWVEMGAVNLHRPQDIQLLKNGSCPMLHITRGKVYSQEWTYTTTLEPLEVRFIEVEWDEVQE